MSHKNYYAQFFLSVMRPLWMTIVGAGLATMPVFVANAAGTWQWTAQVTGVATPVQGSPFPTKEQAVQALTAAIVQHCADVGYPCPAASTAQQEVGIIAMTPNSKIYSYSLFTPSSPTAYTCYVWTDDPAPSSNVLTLGPYGCYPDEASAVASQTLMQGCYTTLNNVGGVNAYSNSWVTPAGDWSPQLLAQQGTDFPLTEGSSKVYNIYAQSPLLQNNCATTFEASELLWRTRGASCPENFSVTSHPYPTPVGLNNTTLCYAPSAGTVTAGLLDCQANGGPSTIVGDPCDVATGDFTQTEKDYSASAGLNFTRTYHSLALESYVGTGWTHNYAAKLVLTRGVPTG